MITRDLSGFLDQTSWWCNATPPHVTPHFSSQFRHAAAWCGGCGPFAAARPHENLPMESDGDDFGLRHRGFCFFRFFPWLSAFGGFPLSNLAGEGGGLSLSFFVCCSSLIIRWLIIFHELSFACCSESFRTSRGFRPQPPTASQSQDLLDVEGEVGPDLKHT